MRAIVFLSIGVGMGLWALMVWLVPQRPPLAALMSRLEMTPIAPFSQAEDDDGWMARAGKPFVGVLRVLGLPNEKIRKDVTTVGISIERYLGEKALLTVTGLLVPSGVGLIFVIGGHPLPWQFSLSAAAMLAVGGFLCADARLKTKAGRRRVAFRKALSTYLDLVQILLAGGAGVEEALNAAAAVGRGWPCQQLRRALETAHFTRTSPCKPLEQLGEELGIGELSELAASLSLVGYGSEKGRDAVIAKAAALRRREGADAEAGANVATARVALAYMLMAIGTLLFIVYPALVPLGTS